MPLELSESDNKLRHRTPYSRTPDPQRFTTLTMKFTSIISLLLTLSSPGRNDSAEALVFPPKLEPIRAFLTTATKKSTFAYTHLECNGQLWQAANGNTKATVVIDPLASQLDFGIPWGYRANKQVLSECATIDLICDAQPSHCLLTMGLDDHTHVPTIRKLIGRIPELNFIVAPSCEKKMLDLGLSSSQVTVLSPGETHPLFAGASVTATQGALVGPPWQARENGYLLELNEADEGQRLSVYYEPHSDVILDNIKSIRADVMVAPVTKQSLPAQVPKEGQFTLVYGGERTLEIGESLGAKVIIPLGNGALDTDGILAGLVSAEGDLADFQKQVEERNAGRNDEMRVAIPSPGVELTLSV
ncbi:hypothetical protein ACHAWF_003194 [Thalassiosira exigua]